jgi:hypothetical protein
VSGPSTVSLERSGYANGMETSPPDDPTTQPDVNPEPGPQVPAEHDPPESDEIGHPDKPEMD